jgi:hypothetical protein
MNAAIGWPPIMTPRAGRSAVRNVPAPDAAANQGTDTNG